MENSQKRIKIKETIVVEGKYDKIRLAPLFDANIIELGGFRIYNNKVDINMPYGGLISIDVSNSSESGITISKGGEIKTIITDLIDITDLKFFLQTLSPNWQIKLNLI